MTKAEIFIQILSEVSGKSKQQVGALLAASRKSHPGGKWDEEVPENEAERLLKDLSSEGPGVLNRLIKGAMEVARPDGDD